VSFSPCHMMNRGYCPVCLDSEQNTCRWAAGKETLSALRIFCLNLKLLNRPAVKKLPVTGKAGGARFANPQSNAARLPLPIRTEYRTERAPDCRVRYSCGRLLPTPSLAKRAHRSPMLLLDRPRPPPRPTVLCSDRRAPVDLCQGPHPFRLVARAVDHGGKIQIGDGNLSAADQTRGAEMAHRESEPCRLVLS
jgi:hypothetical protein